MDHDEARERDRDAPAPAPAPWSSLIAGAYERADTLDALLGAAEGGAVGFGSALDVATDVFLPDAPAGVELLESATDLAGGFDDFL